MNDHDDDGTQQPDADEPLFPVSLAIVFEQLDWSAEDLLGIPEIEAMFLQVLVSLVLVPDDLHESWIHQDAGRRTRGWAGDTEYAF